MNPNETELPKISVIISTYNAEEWLKKVLWGFNCQLFKDFEVVIADDGSGPKTKELLEELSAKVFYNIVHVWQEDDGFQKSRILNKAIEACNAGINPASNPVATLTESPAITTSGESRKLI